MSRNLKIRFLFSDWALALIICCVSMPSLLTAQDDLGKELPRIPAVEPDKALSTFAIHSGFKLIPSAVEPLVADPVSMVYDAQGRAYVVEMRGYPYPEERPTGKVRLLEDTNGDGLFDRGTDFLTDLDWPTSVVPYKDGVFVAAPPEIIYARDMNGDGVADVKKVMFSGFGTQNVQALLNGLLWGNDGFIYGSGGGNGGEIKNHNLKDSKPVSIRGRDFRFKPDGSVFEAISGGGQFGHSLDDWGHRFVCNNSNHIRQIMLPSHYLERNPNLFQNSVLLDIPTEGAAAPVYRKSQAEPWRIVRTRQRASDPAFRKRAPATELVATGFFTSATGVTIYRGSSYPEVYRNNAFIGDVGGNLVHRKIMKRAGTHYEATRADQGVEFITSTDNWFRPVNFANTPHGTIMILDMYRETIEHPFSIPEPIKMHLDLTSGKNRGRLYHLVHENFKLRNKPDLKTASSSQLVSLLSDRDAWWRETAQRLLLERLDLSVAPELEKVATSSDFALGRAHALWSLASLGILKPETLAPAFNHSEPGLREQAAKLSEPFLKSNPEMVVALTKLADDPDGFVRLQAAFSLGEVASTESTEALTRIACQDPDSWTKAAILSSISGREISFLTLLLANSKAADSQKTAWAEEIAALVASRADEMELTSLLELGFATDRQKILADPILNGLALGASRSGKNLGTLIPASQKKLLGERIEVALATIRDTKQSESIRIGAIRVARLGSAANLAKACEAMLGADNPPSVQLAAVQTMSSLGQPALADILLGHWESLGPSQRREVIEALMVREDRQIALVKAIEKGIIPPAELDPARRSQLSESKNKEVSQRAKAVFASLPSVSRQDVLKNYASTIKLVGDWQAGEAVFKKVCATCHRAGNSSVGADVGPNLQTVVSRSPEDLLGHILEPNREIAPQYLNYSIGMKDGRVLTGMIAAESSNSIVLKRAEGITETVARSQIEEVRSTGQSLMPEGLEKGLEPKDFADLIQFIKQIGSR